MMPDNGYATVIFFPQLFGAHNHHRHAVVDDNDNSRKIRFCDYLGDQKFLIIRSSITIIYQLRVVQYDYHQSTYR